VLSAVTDAAQEQAADELSALVRSPLSAIFGRGRQVEGPRVIRLSAAERPPLIYAIGDIHGCLDALLSLEAQIVADAEGVAGEKWLVYLGDYVDRGPRSAHVIDHLMTEPPPGCRRICLRGNHEAMMLAALDDPFALDDWLALGGDATLLSYGVASQELEALRRGGRATSRLNLIRAHIPDEHVGFLRDLVAMLSVPGYVFVHAGLRPGVSFMEQDAEDMIWIRGEFLDAMHDFGAVVVHGHTIAPEPELLAGRIGIDTGCFMTGRLTALRIDATGAPTFLHT
jgi:serine/threonine protein phosphatase 1